MKLPVITGIRGLPCLKCFEVCKNTWVCRRMHAHLTSFKNRYFWDFFYSPFTHCWSLLTLLRFDIPEGRRKNSIYLTGLRLPLVGSSWPPWPKASQGFHLAVTKQHFLWRRSLLWRRCWRRLSLCMMCPEWHLLSKFLSRQAVWWRYSLSVLSCHGNYSSCALLGSKQEKEREREMIFGASGGKKEAEEEREEGRKIGHNSKTKRRQSCRITVLFYEATW